MKRRLVDRLCCPLCRGQLSLVPFAEEELECGEPPTGAAVGDDTTDPVIEPVIREGLLLCGICSVWYPIHAYVPVMLTFRTPFHTRFASVHSERLISLRAYEMPDGTPKPGERSVQETFTDEWDCVQESDLSFLSTLDDLIATNREVWLRWLKDLPDAPKRVLDVGCGLGSESLALKTVARGAEVIGIDLNLALLRSAGAHRTRRDLHFVIASLFALPFPPSSFDLVYSQGVIHHTFSTAAALQSIAALVRVGGHLFIWVYGAEDRLVSRYMAAKSAVESIVRPVVSRSPRAIRDLFFGIASVVAHPVIKVTARHTAKWKIRNSNHTLRDRFSPRFAHRQGYNQVFAWFEELGFRVVDVQSPHAFRRLYKRPMHGVGVTGVKLEERG